MKNKRILYVLLPAVLVIWGLVFQRIWSATETAEVEIPSGVASTSAPARYGPSRRPPVLLLSYSDPFKSSKSQFNSTQLPTGPREAAFYSRAATAPTLNLPVLASPAAAMPLVWPQVKYLGSINNSRRNNSIALLLIDTKEAMIKVGENKTAIQVVRVFRDSVRVRFQGHERTIVRNDEP